MIVTRGAGHFCLVLFSIFVPAWSIPTPTTSAMPTMSFTVVDSETARPKSTPFGEAGSSQSQTTSRSLVLETRLDTLIATSTNLFPVTMTRIVTTSAPPYRTSISSMPNTFNDNGMKTSDLIALGVGLPVGILTLMGMAITAYLQLQSYKEQRKQRKLQARQQRQAYRGFGSESDRSGRRNLTDEEDAKQRLEKAIRADEIMPTKPARVLLGDPATAWNMINHLRGSRRPLTDRVMREYNQLERG